MLQKLRVLFVLLLLYNYELKSETFLNKENNLPLVISTWASVDFLKAAQTGIYLKNFQKILCVYSMGYIDGF